MQAVQKCEKMEIYWYRIVKNKVSRIKGQILYTCFFAVLCVSLMLVQSISFDWYVIKILYDCSALRWSDASGTLDLVTCNAKWSGSEKNVAELFSSSFELWASTICPWKVKTPLENSRNVEQWLVTDLWEIILRDLWVTGWKKGV